MALRNPALAFTLTLALQGCSSSGCEKYASSFGCDFVENEAAYEVWYWRNVERDNPEDEVFIGQAVGVDMCEGNARAFASVIGEPFNDRAYICVLNKEGVKEKHRKL